MKQSGSDNNLISSLSGLSSRYCWNSCRRSRNVVPFRGSALEINYFLCHCSTQPQQNNQSCCFFFPPPWSFRFDPGTLTPLLCPLSFFFSSSPLPSLVSFFLSLTPSSFKNVYFSFMALGNDTRAHEIIWFFFFVIVIYENQPKFNPFW